MMEPLLALGVASNVVQFIDFTAKVLSRSVKIYRATQNGNGDGDATDLESLTIHFEGHNRALTESLRRLQKDVEEISGPDKEILRMCAECEKLIANVLTTLRGLKASKATLWNSFVSALKTAWSENEIQALRQTLDSYRQQLTLYLLASVRYVPLPSLLLFHYFLRFLSINRTLSLLRRTNSEK